MAITVLKGIPFLRQELTKLFMKKAAEKSGIMTVPFKNKKLQLDIEDRLQKYIRDAEKQGVDLDMVSNENLKYTINLNENVDPISRAISADSPEGRAITEKLFGKKGDVVDMTGKKMDTSQGIMGGKSVKELMESGQVQKGTDDIKISEKITDRDMFKNADQRLKGPIKGKMDMGEFGKVDVETDYSASINRKEFFDPKAKNMYDKTVKTGPEFFKAQKEQILNTINRKKKEMVPPTHSNYKLLKKSLQDQEDALEAIKVTEDLGGNENMFDFLRTQNIADYKAKPLQRSNYTKTDAEIKAKFDKDNQDSIQRFKDKMKDDPEDMAKGGRAGLYTGGMVDVEPNLSDIGHGSDALMARTRLVAPDSQATTSTGLNYLLAEDNDNIRVPFSGGGMSKRAFLKLMATIGGGVAAAKTGILGLSTGAGKQVTKEVAKEVAGSGTPPPYFFKLAEKIKNMGDDVTKGASTQEREVVTSYKDYMMTEDLGTGNIVIRKRNEGVFYDQDGIISDEYMTYNPGRADETTKVRPIDEYDEYTVRPDGDGKLSDSEDGLDNLKEIMEEAGDTDSMTLKK